MGGGYESGTCRLYVRTCPLDFKLVLGLRVCRKIWTGLCYRSFIPNPYTFNSVTRSGHVKYQESPLASNLHGNSAWKVISFYLLYSQLHIVMPGGHVLIMCMLPCIINDEHIFLSFGKDLHGQSSCHLYMAFQLLQNMACGHVKVRKVTGHVFYMAIPSNTTESVELKCS